LAELKVVGPGYTLRVVEGSSPPRQPSPGEIEVGLDLLRLDAEAGVVGESLASLLLPALEFDEELRGLVESYRRRVVIEEAAELGQRLGPALRHVRVPALYFPLARMSRHAATHACYFSLTPQLLEALSQAYEAYLPEVGDARDGYVTISPSRVRVSLSSVFASLFKTVLTAVGSAGLYFWLSPRACGPSPLLLDPLAVIMPEEGLISGRCELVEHLSEVLGNSGECRRSSLLFSARICEGGDEKVVIKGYAYAVPKWLIAGLLSLGAYPFRQTPSGRASNEYAHFIALRRVVRTPRVLGLCVSPLNASMAREYVEGEVVMNSRDPGAWEAGGEVLARVHRGGFALGDPNPGNIVISGGEEYLIDAEQAGRFTPVKGAWDLAVYYYYARFFGAPRDLVAESLRGYVKGVGGLWNEVRRELLGPRVAPFIAAMPPFMVELLELLKGLG